MANSREQSLSIVGSTEWMTMERWHQSLRTGTADGDDPQIEELCNGDAWMTFPLRNTGLDGYLLDPFVLDVHSGGWIQGWSDGRTLTLATPRQHLAFAVSFLRSIHGVG